VLIVCVKRELNVSDLSACIASEKAVGKLHFLLRAREKRFAHMLSLATLREKLIDVKILAYFISEHKISARRRKLNQRYIVEKRWLDHTEL
jgi:hypothetical protein